MPGEGFRRTTLKIRVDDAERARDTEGNVIGLWEEFPSQARTLLRGR